MPRSGPLGPIPDDWKIKKLSEVTSKIGSGATPRGGEETYLQERDRYALVRSQSVLDRFFDLSSLSFISDDQAHDLRNAEVRSGDVLLNITGDGITFSRSALVPDEALPACVNQHVAIIRPNTEDLLPGYLLAYLTHPEAKKYIEGFNSGGCVEQLQSIILRISKFHFHPWNIKRPFPERWRHSTTRLQRTAG